MNSLFINNATIINLLLALLWVVLKYAKYILDGKANLWGVNISLLKNYLITVVLIWFALIQLSILTKGLPNIIHPIIVFSIDIITSRLTNKQVRANTNEIVKEFIHAGIFFSLLYLVIILVGFYYIIITILR